MVLWVATSTHSYASDDNIVFRDDFKGKTLHPELEIAKEDSSRWSLTENEYLLLVTHEKIKNSLNYMGSLPENYDFTVKFQTTPEIERQTIRLSIGNGKDAVQLGYYIANDLRKYGGKVKRQVFFGKDLGDEWSKYEKDFNTISIGGPLYLSLIKKGIEYTGYYSMDGEDWFDVGTHVYINLNGTPHAFVHNDRSGMPESGIKIDYFEIKKIN